MAGRPGKRPGVTTGAGNSPDEDGRSKRKRETIDVACTPCQRRKSRCDGVKPVCGLCSRKRTTCEYAADLRRNSNLRLSNKQLSIEVQYYRRISRKLKLATPEEASRIIYGLNVDGMDTSSTVVEDDAELTPGTSVGPPDTTASSPWAIVSDSTWSPFQGMNMSPDVGPSPRMASDAVMVDSSLPAFSQINAPEYISRQAPNLIQDDDGFGFDAPEDNTLLMRSPPRDNKDVSITMRADNAGTITAAYNAAVLPSTEAIMLHQDGVILDAVVPLHHIMPLVFPDVDPAGGAYSSQYASVYRTFQLQQRQALVSGKPPAAVLGGDTVDCSTMFSEESCNRAHPLSGFVCRVTKFCVHELVTILAYMHMRYRFMQWLIRPNEETYSRLPALMKPLPAQRMVAHPLWVDFVPIPAFRRMLILQPEARAKEWQKAILSHRTTWGRSIHDAIKLDPRAGAMRPTAEFQAFIDNPAHWTISASALKEYPYFRGCSLVRAQD